MTYCGGSLTVVLSGLPLFSAVVSDSKHHHYHCGYRNQYQHKHGHNEPGRLLKRNTLIIRKGAWGGRGGRRKHEYPLVFFIFFFFLCLAFALMPTGEGCNHHICKRSPPSRSVGSYPNAIGCVFPQVGQDVAGGVARYVNRVEGRG